MYKKIKIANVYITKINYIEMLAYVENCIEQNKKNIISYAAFHVINLARRSKTLAKKITTFDLVHSDGLGVYLASKILYGKNGFKNKITGSDFYPFIIQRAIELNWRLFFFGDKKDTLDNISLKYKNLNIVGLQEGYGFDSSNVIRKINDAHADILIVGLGSPKQEDWINHYSKQLNVKIVIIVGDGIKIFADNKIRGPKLFQIIGLEWLARLISNPSLFWKRYLIGIPIFLFIVLKQKLRKKSGKLDYDIEENI